MLLEQDFSFSNTLLSSRWSAVETLAGLYSQWEEEQSANWSNLSIDGRAMLYLIHELYYPYPK